MTLTSRVGRLWLPCRPREGNFGTTNIAQRIYALGGDDLINFLSTSEFFNVTENPWSTISSMPTARSWTAAETFLGNIIVIGGNPDNLISSNTVEVLNPSNNTWSTITPLPEERDAHTVIAAGRKIYVISGGRYVNAQYVVEAGIMIGELP